MDFMHCPISRDGRVPFGVNTVDHSCFPADAMRNPPLYEATVHTSTHAHEQNFSTFQEAAGPKFVPLFKHAPIGVLKVVCGTRLGCRQS